MKYAYVLTPKGIYKKTIIAKRFIAKKQEEYDELEGNHNKLSDKYENLHDRYKEVYERYKELAAQNTAKKGNDGDSSDSYSSDEELKAKRMAKLVSQTYHCVGENHLRLLLHCLLNWQQMEIRSQNKQDLLDIDMSSYLIFFLVLIVTIN